MNVENVKDFLKTLPTHPGIYRMLDKQKRIVKDSAKKLTELLGGTFK